SAEFRKVHQYLTFCTFTPAQVALAEILEKDPQHYLDLPAFYQAKRDRFRELLAGSKFELLPVGGAYFQIADYSQLSKADDLAFCEWLAKEGGVAAIPISAFYETPPADQRLIRFCFAKSDATLEQAATRLKAL
ncbi:MAG: aminotransferase class I/II-fold pyridoxal phosphate-dependent enzyme, partial [Dokdonella sp.]